jgi:hypothetical protein
VPAVLDENGIADEVERVLEGVIGLRHLVFFVRSRHLRVTIG